MSTVKKHSTIGIGRPLGATTSGTGMELTGSSLTGRPLTGSREAMLAWLGLSGLALTTLVVAVAASHTDLLLPESIRPIPDRLAGPFSGVGPDLGRAGLMAVMALMAASYGLVMRHVDRLSARVVLGAIAAVGGLMLLAPPLLSTDVFSYMVYGRMGTLYNSNPYLQGPHAIALDSFYPYVGAKWVTIPTAYGPLFTLLSYPIAALGVAASVVAYKLVGALSVAVVIWAVWGSARLRNLSPVRAVALVGLNPLLVVFGIGGAHNDLLMLAGLASGVFLLLRDRQGSGAGTLVAAAAVKLTAGLMLPFAVAGLAGDRGRRRAVLVGAAAALGGLVVVSLAFFGTAPTHLLSTLQRSQASGDWHSIPGFISTRLGLGVVGHLTGLVLALGFLIFTGLLLRRVHQGRLDWITGAAWATVAMLATASSLLPWYVVWLLPLAALARDRRLERTAIWMTGIVMVIQIIGYLPQSAAFLIL